MRFPTRKWISSLHLCAAVSLPPPRERAGVRGAISDPKNGFHLSTVRRRLPLPAAGEGRGEGLEPSTSSNTKFAAQEFQFKRDHRLHVWQLPRISRNLKYPTNPDSSSVAGPESVC